MSKKVVLKLEINDDKDKQKALKAVSSLSGIESISIDMKDKKLTIVGEVDPIQIVSKLRKLWGTQILTVGPAKEPADKKKEEEEKKKAEEKKKEEEKKKLELEEAKKKEEERKRKESEQIAELWKNYRNLHPNPAHNYYHQYHPNSNGTWQHQHLQQLQHQQQQQHQQLQQQHYYVHSAEENPNSCVIS